MLPMIAMRASYKWHREASAIPLEESQLLRARIILGLGIGNLKSREMGSHVGLRH